MTNEYYVYVYIDPRNLEEFYYGKGRGSRKDAHLTDSSDNLKARRIAAIRKEGLDPIIRVIARNLSEHDALLVEKTLLWKLGRQLTNVSSGHYADNFRPHDTLHRELPGFDFEKGIYYYNVGEGNHRHWDDYRELGYISAGQGARWRKAMLGFQPGDVIAACLKGKGFVGIGRITESARPIRMVSVKGRPLLKHPLRCSGAADNVESDKLCEYACVVEWIKAIDRKHAKKIKTRDGIFTTTHVRATLAGQPGTMRYLEQTFGVDLKALIV